MTRPDGAPPLVTERGIDRRNAKQKHKRFRVGLDDDGGFDELTLAGGFIHLEMMDRSVCWVKVGDQVCSVNLRTKRVTPWENY